MRTYSHLFDIGVQYIQCLAKRSALHFAELPLWMIGWTLEYMKVAPMWVQTNLEGGFYHVSFAG